MKKNYVVYLLILCAAFISVSCSKKDEITFDNSDPLALTPGIEWAVVTEPYAAFRAKNNYESEVINEARRGEIYEVTGKAIVINKKTDPVPQTTWYEFEKGWLDSSAITIYDNKMRAETAAAKLSK